VALIEEAIDHAKRAAVAMQKAHAVAPALVPQLCPPWGRSLDADAIELYDFILDRLRGYYLEQGIQGELFEAVAVLKPASLLDFDRRLRAVLAFSVLPEAASLAAANKRIGNILRQANHQQITLGHEIIESALEAGAETEFRQALARAHDDFLPLSERCEYVAMLGRLALLRAPVDAFFDGVMVMSEHPIQRQNRLNLLHLLHTMFMRVADIGRLPGR
jgi:glycyl-tRNA synthetase beta chain